MPKLPKILSIYFIAPAIPILSRINKEIDFSKLLEAFVLNWREITRTFIHDFFDWIHVVLPYKGSAIDGVFFSVFMFALGINCLYRKQIHFISSTRRLYVLKSRWGRLTLLSSISLLLALYYVFFLMWGMLPEDGHEKNISSFVIKVLVYLMFSFPVALIGIFGLMSPFFIKTQDPFIDYYFLRRFSIKTGHIMAYMFFCGTQGLILIPSVFRDMMRNPSGSFEINLYVSWLIIPLVLIISFVLTINWKILRQPLIWVLIIVASDQIIKIPDPFIIYVGGVINNA